MRKYIVLLFVLCIRIINAQDAPPDWSVNPSAYQFTSNIVAAVKLNNAPEPAGSNIAAFFSGGEVRGVGTPVQIGGQKLYFITAYSNHAGETLTAKIYIASLDTVLSAAETIVFQPNAVIGSVQSPFTLNAFLNFNSPPVLTGIPDQTVPYGGTFTPIQLPLYANDPEGGPLLFSYRGADLLTVNISQQGTATVSTPSASFFGSDTIIFRASEPGTNGLWDEDTVVFTVLRNDRPPQLGGIPNQRTGSNGGFTPLHLNDYLTELDGDSISYSFVFAAPGMTDPQPDWNINPSQFQSTMTLVAEVSSLGKQGGTTRGRLAAFSNGQLRGFTSEVSFSGKFLYFLTIYSNTNGDTISLRFYDADAGRLIPATGKIVFIENSSLGTPANPQKISAGNIVVRISANGIAEFTLPDPAWQGSETIIFKATDIGTLNSYSDTARVLFERIADRAPLLRGIPDQIIIGQNPFNAIPLNNFLTELDGDPVAFSAHGNNALEVAINSSGIATVTSPMGWTGAEYIRFRATDISASSLYTEDTVLFRRLPQDNPPDLSGIPDQTIGQNGNFTPFDLDNFVTELDNDSLRFYYSFVPKPAEPEPDWSVNPSQFQLTMNLVAEVTALGKMTDKISGKLSAWKGNQLQGSASPVRFGSKVLYYITMYANENGEALTFRYYDPESQREMPVAGSITFIQNSSLGSPNAPYQFKAGHIIFSVSATNVVSFSVPDKSWIGNESVMFYVQDINTIQQLKDSVAAGFRIIQDNAPLLSGIADQTISGGQMFTAIDLDSYLTELDGDGITFSYSGNSSLSVTLLPGNIAQVTVADSNFTGEEYIRFRATDNTVNGLFSEDTVMFKVLPRDNPPFIGNIPNQTIGINNTFNPFDLDSYLTELDGDQVEWSYQIVPPDTVDLMPEWTINPAGFEMTMNIIAKVKSAGEFKNGPNHKLAAFSGGVLRGTADPVQMGGSWIYFLTVYANTNGEQIRFRFYDAQNMKIYPVRQSMQFLTNEIAGTVTNPLHLDAGFIIMDLNSNNFVSADISDSEWRGTEKVKFTVKDVATLNGFSSDRIVSYTVLPQVVTSVQAPDALAAQPLRRPLRIKLTWNDNAQNETAYVLERKSGDSLQLNSYSVITELPAGSTVYEDTTVTDTVVYTYRVYARNSITTSGYSDQRTVKSLYTILPIASPLMSSAVNLMPGKVALNWTDSANNETGYRVWRKEGDTSSADIYTVIAELQPNEVSFIDTSFAFQTQYSYKTEAFNADTTSDFSNQISLVTFPQVPAAAYLVAPPANAIGVVQPAAFVWNRSQRAERYHLFIASDSLFTNVVWSDSAVTDTFKLVSGLNNLTDYFWRVRAHNIGGSSEFSQVFRFRTIGGASLAQPLIPLNNSVNVLRDSVRFAWSRSYDILNHPETILNYWFEIYTDTTSAAVFRDSALTDTSLVMRNLLNDANYFWRVRAKNETGWNNFSAFNRLRTIVPLPVMPVLVSPANGVTNAPLSFIIRWKKDRYTVNYHLQVALDSSFSSFLMNDSTLTDTLKLLQGLTDGTAYHWRVSGSNIAGTSSFSQAWKFTTRMHSPDSLSVTAIPGRIAELRWSDRSSSEMNYVIERKAGDASLPGVFTQIATLPANTTSYRDSVSGDTVVYTYRVKAFNQSAASAYSNAVTTTLLTSADDESGIPEEYALHQNYPNPFNPSTRIKYQIPVSGHVTVRVYSITGALTATLTDEYKDAGYYTVTFDAAVFSSGVYLVRIQAGEFNQTRKMLLLK